MRKTYGIIFTALLLSVALPLWTQEGGVLGSAPLAENGVVTVESDRSVEDTVSDIRGALEEAGFFILAVVDHSQNAQDAGLSLPPTRLIIFGNPSIGTQFMQDGRTMGIDLPQKYLVWEDGDGQVHVSYNDPYYLARRHGLDEGALGNLLERVASALQRFATAGG